MKNQRVKLHLLPTEMKGNQGHTLWKNKDGQLLHTKTSSNDLQGQYLYATSDEKPKEVDWCYDEYNKVVFKSGNNNTGASRKIIATTDPKLTICDECGWGNSVHKIDCVSKTSVPQLQQSFLKEFVANPNGKWEVEYEGLYNTFGHLQDKGKLKLNQDNTVSITPVEEKMYSREEVIKLLNAYGNDVANEFNDCDCDHTEPFSFDEEDWIKNNLKK